jgi:hypothetical protein
MVMSGTWWVNSGADFTPDMAVPVPGGYVERWHCACFTIVRDYCAHGRDPGEIYRELMREFGEPAYDRVEAPATPEQKQRLTQLSYIPTKTANPGQRIQGGDGRDFEINLGRKARQWRGGVTTFAKPNDVFVFRRRFAISSATT